MDFPLLFILFVYFTCAASFSPSLRCKCTPQDSCWPSRTQWHSFNMSLNGKLIQNIPPALPCYPGPAQNAQQCSAINMDLADQTFISNNPIALSYPTDSCLPINRTTVGSPCTIGYQNTSACESDASKNLPVIGKCSIGDQPRYTVNATELSDVTEAVLFARQRNIRLVIRNTGHDILTRSTGYGSLQVWLRYLRRGIKFQESYEPTHGCLGTNWTGSSFEIRGGYTWEDIYPLAAARNVVVVGGGTPSVSCLGGWMQGGGHSPATHDFGLGADQILAAEVILASGELVVANACENPDIFFAIRGGGPSSYGIVVSMVIKVHPTNSVAAQIFRFAPLTPSDMPAFMDAVATVYQAYPDLSDSGFSGYGSWSINSPTPSIGNYSTSFVHTIAIFGKSVDEAKNAFSPVTARFASYNGTSLYMEVKYLSFPTYVDYYDTLSDIVTPVGQRCAVGSRLLGRKALTGNGTALKATLQTIAGSPEQYTSIDIVFVGGGQVFVDAADPYSGVNPAWRETYVHNIIARGWAPYSSNATIRAVHDDITHVKTQAMKALAPDTGSYMNEADRFDPDYLQNFYGKHQERLEQIKWRYDPTGLFYCPTCVGSDHWAVEDGGKLCWARS